MEDKSINPGYFGFECADLNGSCIFRQPSNTPIRYNVIVLLHMLPTRRALTFIDVNSIS